MVLTRWQQFVELQRERRRRLQTAFISVMEADESNSLRLSFDRWQNYRQQGQLLSAKSGVALQASQRRILQASLLTHENAVATKQPCHLGCFVWNSLKPAGIYLREDSKPVILACWDVTFLLMQNNSGGGSTLYALMHFSTD